MKLSDNFSLQELVAPEIYNHPAIGNRAADFIHHNTVGVLEDLRREFGPITINTWNTGGNYSNSGLRSPESTVGAALSAHRFGTGFDLKFIDHDPVYVYNVILASQHKYKNILRMENAEKTKTWLHIEITDNRSGNIALFNP